MLQRERLGRAVIERHLPGQDLVGQHAECVEIDQVSVADLHLTTQRLRRQVVHRSDDLVGRARSTLLHGDPEVEQDDPIFWADHHVCGLEIAVDQLVEMQVVDRIGDRVEKVEAGLDRQRVWMHEVIRQRPALDQLHRKVFASSVGAAMEHVDDGWVTQRREGSSFVDQELPGAVPGDLQRDATSKSLVVGFVDVTHGTRAELPDDLEDAVDDLARM